MADEETNISFGLCKNDAEFQKYFHSSIKDLRSIVISNIEYYQRGKSSIHACFYATSCVLLERTQVLEPLVIDIVPKLKDYDFSEEVQANGYRSFISIVNRCCIHLLQLCRHININKNSLLFRSSHYLKELEAYVEVLGQLMACLGYLQQLILYSRDGNLFLTDDKDVGDDILMEVEMLNTDCFYGRCLGFQFSESMQKVLHTVVIAMATFSECYEESSQVIQIASSLVNSGKYYVDYELRARQVVDITRTADIKFCKAFWSITDSPFVHQLRSFTFPHVEVSEAFTLEPETFDLPLVGGDSDDVTVVITPPCAHTGPAPIRVRLISHAIREGMTVTRKRFKPKTGSAKVEVLGKSPGLLFHCHGGGFVAQSSQSHENYLRVWARHLEMPILSVDYSLAPDLPFPRALEETFYAYAWALKNPDKLGWTGERVCFAGDSAGGNIVISTALRAASYEIRIPDGIMAAYTPTLVQYTPSPARLMAMIDPLLPVGILTRCLAAYAGIADKLSSALATPIFCNPGKVENWEMVNDDEAENLPNISYNLPACSEQSGAISASDPPSYCDNPDRTKPQVFHDRDDLPMCTSLDNLSDCEFVVCDMDKFDEDADHYTGDCTVIKHGLHTKDGVLESEGVTKMDSEEELKVVNQTNKDSEISYPVQNPDVQSSRLMTDIVSGSEDEVKISNDKDEANDGLSPGFIDTAGISTVEDMLKRIDSLAKIEVKNDRIKMETGDSELYATCKELQEEENVRPLSRKWDMISPSCRSIEDLINTDETSVEQNDEHVTDVCNTNDLLARSVPNADKPEELTKELCDMTGLSTKHLLTRTDRQQSYLANTKQSSISDNSDSGIHDGTDLDNSNSHGLLESTSKPETLHFQGASSHLGGEKSDMLILDNTSDMSEKVGKDSKSLKKKDKRHMSLDFPVTFHPGQGIQLTLQKSKESPVSPKLSPGSRSFKPKLYSVQRKIAQSPIQLFRQLPIVKNMYMSPLLAPDDITRKLPPVHLTACHFDPLLDDSVMFAKKLASLGKSVSLKVFDNLPHGFLSFSDASVEARQASNYCMEKIKEVLDVKTKF